MRRVLFVGALCCSVGGTLVGTAGRAVAQQEDRVTVGMRNGDVIEGAFRGATEAEISIQVAGQSLALPVPKIKYVSFVGALGTEASGAGPSPADTKPAAGSLEDAFQALDELQAALRIGVLRAQYAEKLVETLPRVNAYLDQSPDEWLDVQALLHSALFWYKAPLGEITKYSNPWENASDSFGHARDEIDYARALAAKPEERTHPSGLRG
jgi:hypothetical protein